MSVASLPPQTLILNVDDNEGGRYAKSRILKLAGYRVIEAANGTDALSAAEQQQPSLILLDVNLPDINGLEVCRRIKENPATQNLLVLQTSASAVGSRDRVKAFDGGADSYLIEPIEPEELIANVRALLRLKAAEDAHRNAERALRESEERFRQMAETIGDVFWIYDPEQARTTYVSPAYAKVWRRPAGEIDQAGDIWQFIHPEDRERVRAQFRRGLESGAYDEEFRLQHDDGSITWIRDRGFPVRDSGGIIRRMTGVAHDITSRKHSEQLLVDADKRKDEFLAMLAHELRNPLAPIRNAVELLRLATPPGSDIPVKAREIIARQVDHMSRLVDELLDVSRITHGKISLVKERVPLSSIVRAASEAVRPLMDNRNHRFEVVLPEQEAWVFGDSVRLSQIINNLLNNAAKYTAPHGVITLTAMQRAGRLRISVRDTGMGIDARVLPHVFDLFMQADPSLDRSQGGLGVGLSLAQSLAHMHGGHIQAASGGKDQGSEFVLDVPAATPPPMTEPVVETPRAPAPHLRILIIEDSRDAAEGMSLLLATCGHTVNTAFDGLSGLAMARIMKPDLIILDIGLPNMDGYQLARELRLAPETSQAKLIALTGYGQAGDRQKSEAAGIDRHLVKPVDLRSLEAVIAELQTVPTAQA